MYINQTYGKLGENIAEEYLQKAGYKIIDKNFNCKQGEIDIIAKDIEYLIFIEVKTRTSIKYGNPSEAVNKEKQKHIYKSAEYYIYKNRIEDIPMRFDVIEIYLAKNKNYVHHIKDAFTK